MLGQNFIGANTKAKAKILFDLCCFSMLRNVNTPLSNLCIHSKQSRFHFRVRSNIIPPLKIGYNTYYSGIFNTLVDARNNIHKFLKCGRQNENNVINFVKLIIASSLFKLTSSKLWKGVPILVFHVSTCNVQSPIVFANFFWNTDNNFTY